jgi:hypothetical protein
MADSDKVGLEPLDVDNYEEWAARMEALLVWKGLWSAIEAPDQLDTTPDMKRKALACLLLHVKRQHLSTIRVCATPQEAWEKLKGIFMATSQERQHQLRTQLSTMRMLSGESLVTYCNRARDLYTNLGLAGGSIPESDVALSILRGLPKEYSMVATVIRTTGGAQSIDGVLSKLLPVQQELQAGQEAEQALLTQRKYTRRSDVECWHCREKGHRRHECPKLRGAERNSSMYAVAM